MLAGRSWQRKYTPDDGDLVRLFYVPALEDAERYDRLTCWEEALGRRTDTETEGRGATTGPCRDP